jgi:hypothetical protein
MSTFPQLLGYNPTYLNILCKKALYFLTSDHNYTLLQEDELEFKKQKSIAKMERSHKISHVVEKDLSTETSHVPTDTDLISDIVNAFDSKWNPTLDLNLNSLQSKKDFAESIEQYLKVGESINLTKERAQKVLQSTPWILSYRTERSQRVIGSLAVSLG